VRKDRKKDKKDERKNKREAAQRDGVFLGLGSAETRGEEGKT